MALVMVAVATPPLLLPDLRCISWVFRLYCGSFLAMAFDLLRRCCGIFIPEGLLLEDQVPSHQRMVVRVGEASA